MPLMDWEKMLLDGTVDIGATTGRGTPVNIGQWPLEGAMVEVYIPGTIEVGTTTLLIEASANDAAYHTVATFTLNAVQTSAKTYFQKLTGVPAAHRYLNYNFSAIQAASDLGTVQIGVILGVGEKASA